MGKANELPDWLDITIWKEFKIHRNRLRKPMTSYAERKVLMRMERAKDEGYDRNVLLDEAIEKGWQTIYPKPRQLSRIYDPNAAPPMYRGSVLNPDYQEWLANKEFMNLNEHGNEDTSTDQITRNKALRSVQRAELDIQDDSLAREITESEQRRLN